MVGYLTYKTLNPVLSEIMTNFLSSKEYYELKLSYIYIYISYKLYSKLLLTEDITDFM
jgi:hypothetical protein